jgi:fatty acid desaturase
LSEHIVGTYLVEDRGDVVLLCDVSSFPRCEDAAVLAAVAVLTAVAIIAVVAVVAVVTVVTVGVMFRVTVWGVLPALLFLLGWISSVNQRYERFLR